MRNDENKPVRMAFCVTSARVQHYDDVIEHMVADQVSKYMNKYGRRPSAQQVAFLRKEMVRYAVIRRDLETAQKLEIRENTILNETYSLHSWSELQQQDI